MTEEILPSLAALRFLNLGQPAADLDALGLLGSDSEWPRWIWENNLNNLIENSQKVAVVLSPASSWTSPNTFNSLRFPRLQVDIWADPDRNDDLSVSVQNAKEKINLVHLAMRRYLHSVSPEIVFWDTLRVLGSSNSGDVTYSPVSDSNGAFMGQTFYNLTIG